METRHIIYNIISSPIGEFVAGATAGGCCLCEFNDRGGYDRIRLRVEKRHRMEMKKGSSPLIEQMEAELAQYFEGKRKMFTLPLDIKGTPFERNVWNELMAIPYGETRSYVGVARRIGNPGAARAVGRANGANYLPIIIPCHRVIQEDGTLRGYGGGLWRKEFLLDLERSHASPSAARVIPGLQLSFSV